MTDDAMYRKFVRLGVKVSCACGLITIVGFVATIGTVDGTFSEKVKSNTAFRLETRPIVNSVPEIQHDVAEIKQSQITFSARLRTVENTQSAHTALLERIDRNTGRG